MKSAAHYPALGYLAIMLYWLIGDKRAAQTQRQFNGRMWLVNTLGGGAELWWNRSSAQLMALRPNKHLQAGEAKTFEANIRAAGYAHSKAADVMVPGDINTWHGVTWKISEVVAAPAAGESTEPTIEQGSLF